MSNDKPERVLSRRTARELTQKEIEGVGGAMGTLTLCSIGPKGQRDGDIGEC